MFHHYYYNIIIIKWHHLYLLMYQFLLISLNWVVNLLELMYTLIVCCKSLHLKTVLSTFYHLIPAIFVVYREWVNVVMVSTWHLVL